MMSRSGNRLASESSLLQLPEPALDLVLQKMDTCSLVSTAATCSMFRHDVAKHISKLEVSCRGSTACASLTLWQQQHSTSLDNLTHCSIQALFSYLWLSDLPCPRLLQLQLKGLVVQLQPTVGYPGVLQHCTGLTALELQNCRVQDTRAALAAIAALTGLQRLVWTGSHDDQGKLDIAELQLSSKLTYLSCQSSHT
jgi:hypothetical protein